LRMAIEPLLEARNMMRKQKAVFDRQLGQMARKDDVCKRLMTVSGVGPIVSLLFKRLSTILVDLRIQRPWRHTSG
jgi:transposase